MPKGDKTAKGANGDTLSRVRPLRDQAKSMSRGLVELAERLAKKEPHSGLTNADYQLLKKVHDQAEEFNAGLLYTLAHVRSHRAQHPVADDEVLRQDASESERELWPPELSGAAEAES
jgi:hypothetical protein